MINGKPVKKYTGPIKAPDMPSRDEHNMFIENAERLRHSATYGDHETIAKVLSNRANPCFADDTGLTPLMMAVNGGHTECVKFILSNDLGIDRYRMKRKSIDMQTCKGYTALHLHCMDGLPWADDILYWLLLHKADTSVADQYGKTARDYAVENCRENDLTMLDKFQEVSQNKQSDPGFVRKMQDDLDTLDKLYAYHYDPLVTIDKDMVVKFPMPQFVFKEERVGSLPEGMLIHEHQIRPLMNSGFSEMGDLTEALHCLDFSRKQADVNQKRREELVKMQDPNWSVPERPKIVDTKKSKNRRKKDDVNIQETD